jgi:hypothetical protein
MATSRSRRLRFAALATLSALAVAASGVEAPRLPGFSAVLGDARLEVGAVRPGALLGLALAQGGEVTLENVAVEAAGSIYRAPRVILSGASVSREEFARLLDPNAAEPLAPRLARLSAKRVTIPELRVEQKLAGDTQVTRYRDVVLSDIVDGRIGSGTSEGATLETKGKDGAGSGTIGRITLTDLDLAEMARIFTEKGGADSAMKRLYGGFTIENVTVDDPKGSRAKIVRITGRDFFARPTADSWSESIKALAAEPDKASGDRDTFARIVDLLDAFRVGSMELIGFEVRDPTGPEPVTVRVARIGFTGPSGNQPADARAEGFDVQMKNGRASIDTIALTGFSLEPTWKGLRELAGASPTDLDPDQLRGLLPTIGTIRLAGLDFDVPNDADDPKAKKDNIRFTVKDVSLTADQPVNGIPTNLRMAVDGLRFPLPADSTEDMVKDLAALGYKVLDLSWSLAANWNEQAEELAVREITLRGADMGAVTLRGTIGNVGRDVFDPDTAVAMVALMGGTARSLDLTVENKGLFERVVAREAKKQGRSPEDVRREYGMGAAVGVPMLLGNSGSAKAVGQAIARFVAKPGELQLSAKAKDPDGLGLADILSLGEPTEILQKIDVTATAR